MIENRLAVENPVIDLIRSRILDGYKPSSRDQIGGFDQSALVTKKAAGNVQRGVFAHNDRAARLEVDVSARGGELRGIPSKKWNTPGGNSFSGREYFNHVWKRFLHGTYAGKRVTLGTLYFHAQEAGWVYVRDTGYGKDFAA